jgi:hypothetical protein
MRQLAERGTSRAARSWLRPAAACAGLVLAAGLAGALPGSPVPAAHADDVTVSQNALRTGWDAAEPELSPAMLRSGRFGQLFRTHVLGQVYAQPVVAGQTVVVATEADWAYGLSATTGRVLWRRHLGTPFPRRLDRCGDLGPYVGVTGTPVYDPQTGAVYLVAETGGGSPSWWLFGLSVRTGRIVKRAWIHGTATNDRHIGFNSFTQFQRPGLLLMNGWVFAAFGSHCDQGSYDGWVASVELAGRTVRLWSDQAGVTRSMAGIWQSGGGLMSDGPGRIFFASGNGVSPPRGRGSSPPGELGQSVVRLAVHAGGVLVARDFFAPANAAALDLGDHDFGSGGPAGLPFGSPRYPGLLVQAGKDGRLFLLNRHHLGGRGQGRAGGDRAVSITGPFSGQYGHPAAFGGTPVVTSAVSRASHDYVYYLGRNTYLRVLKFGVRRTGQPALSTVATSSVLFGYTSGSPVVTSAGTDTSSAVLWVVRAADASGAHGRLVAFGAVPPASCHGHCRLQPLWSAPLGRVSKFSVPATSGGRVYVGTRSGEVFGFGPSRTPVRGVGPVTFGPTRVGTTVSREIVVTAVAKVRVAGVVTTGGGSPALFRVRRVTETGRRRGAARARFPLMLLPGEALHLHVSFHPAAPGGVMGTVRLQSGRPLEIPLSGDGIRTGLYATAGTLPFALVPSGHAPEPVPVGLAMPNTVDIVNGGSTAVTVTAAAVSGGPFSATGLPAAGTRLQPGQVVTVQVTYTPQRPGHDSGRLTVAASSGTPAIVRLTGTAVAARSRVRVTPARLDFGTVRRGRQAAALITVGNSGNQSATFTGTAGPGAPFTARPRVPLGLTLNPGEALHLPVMFTPRVAGRFTAVYRLTWTDRSGTHTLAVPLTGRAR